MNAIATGGLLCRAAIAHLPFIEPADCPSADNGAKTMLQQVFQDALITLQLTGSVPTALIVAAAPLARRAFRR